MPANKCVKSVRARPPRPAPARPTQRRATLWRLTVAVAAVSTASIVFLLGTAAVGHAAPSPTPDPAPGVDSMTAVVTNIRTWLVALLATVATLFLTIGGLRLMWANGDPGEAEKGKAALRSAAIGYALALLSPLIVTIVAGWVS